MKRASILLATIYLYSNQLSANPISDCLARGKDPKACLQLNPVSNAGTIRETELDKLKATLNTSETDVTKVVDSKIFLTEHSHFRQIESLLKYDSSTIILGEEVSKAKENFKKILSKIAEEGSPELQKIFRSQSSRIEGNIDKLTRDELASKLTVLVDMAAAINQPSLASRANGILFSVAPITSSYIENDLSPGLVSKSFDFDLPLNIKSGEINVTQRIFSRNNQDDFNVPGDFESRMGLRNSIKAIRNRQKRQYSFTSHLSGIRVDRVEMYSVNANPGKFTENDRMVSAVWTGLERAIGFGGAGFGVGSFLGTPAIGGVGGALIGGSAGFIGGFIEGHTYPDEKYASGKSIENIQEVTWNWNDMKIGMKVGTTVTDHSTGNKTTKIKSEEIPITVLPRPRDGENPLPENEIDAPTHETADCEGSFCGPKEIIGCDKPEDFDSDGNGERPSKESVEELKTRIRSALNPYIITADGESFEHLIGTINNSPVISNDPKDSLINWGPDGKPNEISEVTPQKPQLDPLSDPVKMEEKFKLSNFRPLKK